MNPPLPQTIYEYLEQLRDELRGADPAMIQDALCDAEEHLRAELAEHPELTEAQMLAQVVSSYGAPEEVADIYRAKDEIVQSALRPGNWMPVASPEPGAATPIPPETSRAPASEPKQPSALRKFFAVGADPRSYAALFYMLLSLATGIFYSVWIIVGLSLSAALSILIIGVPLIFLFLGSVRVLALVEGRLVEATLGVRMPRRTRYTDTSVSIWQRIGAMFTDPRTWLTMLYMLLMLPLGTAYFTIAVTALSVSLALIFAPLLQLIGIPGITFSMAGGSSWDAPLWLSPLFVCFGIVLLFLALHLARGIGYLHGRFARSLLVDSAPV
ncbi:MAG: sensor domain-containing protein [Dokdonella sp.]